MKKRKIKIREVLLGRFKAWARTDELALIEIDPRLPEADRLTILIHEALHIADPKMSEKKVAMLAKVVGPIVWGEHYRRVRQ